MYSPRISSPFRSHTAENTEEAYVNENTQLLISTNGAGSVGGNYSEEKQPTYNTRP